LKIIHDFRYLDDKAGRSKWEGDFFRRPILPLKLTDAGLEDVRHKKTPHSAGFENLINIISEPERMSST
jgi:hypothetical protein